MPELSGISAPRRTNDMSNVRPCLSLKGSVFSVTGTGFAFAVLPVAKSTCAQLALLGNRPQLAPAAHPSVASTSSRASDSDRV
jgi:hypothetical protein